MLYTCDYLAWIRAFLKYLLGDQIPRHFVMQNFPTLCICQCRVQPTIRMTEAQANALCGTMFQDSAGYYQPHLLTLVQLRHF